MASSFDTEVLHARGTAECEAALHMIDRLPPRARRTLGADHGYIHALSWKHCASGT